jgi:uncharacterized protein
LTRYYLDTSALVKLYVREAGTDWLLRLAGSAEIVMHISSLARVELRAAVRRRQRIGDISDQIAGAILDQFKLDLSSLLVVQPITEWAIEESTRLVDRHPLRAYDTLQLAGCLTLNAARNEGDQPTAFVCADAVLLAAARDEGLFGLDPTKPPA